MKIVEIIPSLASGGAQRFVVDLCNELSVDNEIVLITLFPLKEHWSYFRDELSVNVKVISFKKHLGFDFFLFFSLWKLLKQLSPDIVHTHLAAINYIVLAAVYLRKIKYYHTVHNDAQKEAGGIITSTIRKFLFRKKIVVPVTISEESLRSFIAYYSLDAPMIANGRNIIKDRQISTGLLEEFKKYRKHSDTKVIVCLARIYPIKRQALLAKIAKRLSNEGLNIVVLFVGNNYSYPNCVQEIVDLDCQCNYILGEKKNPLEYLKLSDAYCLFSEHEGLPISLIEAMGVGCIPICTPVGGMINLIKDGVNGILSTDLSEDACYVALKRLFLLSNDELQKMKMAAVDAYKPYSMTKCAKEYERIFAK